MKITFEEAIKILRQGCTCWVNDFCTVYDICRDDGKDHSLLIFYCEEESEYVCIRSNSEVAITDEGEMLFTSESDKVLTVMPLIENPVKQAK